MNTAFCCEAVVFIVITGLSNWSHVTGHDLPDHIREELCDNRITFILGRWLSNHPRAMERDSLLRPVCPGPLRHNHCLWTYAKAPPRAVMVEANNINRPSTAFESSQNIFGSSPVTRNQKWNEEKRAWYCLCIPKKIMNTAQICREFEPDSMKLSNTWLETISLV